MATTTWKFRPGDVVLHRETKNLTGVVVRCKLGCEVDSDMGGSDPWYLITWINCPVFNSIYQAGQEPEGTLEPVSRPFLTPGHGHKQRDGFEL